MAIRVIVVYSPGSREVRQIELSLDEGTTAALALQASGLVGDFPELAATPLPLGVWGNPVAPDHVLRDQDRLEVCRPLTVDPKVARRARFAAQGVRSAGLFARKRVGAKAGY